MITRIIAVRDSFFDNFNSFMFTFGYLMTALVVGFYCYSRAAFRVVRLTPDVADKDEITNRLADMGEKTVECFLNQVQQFVPDKLREFQAYSGGHW